VCMKMVSVIMMFAPFGVFALITNTFSTVGADAIGSLVKYILVVLLGLLLHVVVVYGGSLKVFTKVSFIGFVRKFSKVAAVT
ncbi:dicarboxylate/amino acid:cation symporter, partial [Casaltella massiliensis]|nr:dicarboxylate/amino acid:cation symporter [Casaltella massiliensis]